MLPALEDSVLEETAAQRRCDHGNCILTRRRCSLTCSRRNVNTWVKILYSRRMSSSMTALPSEISEESSSKYESLDSRPPSDTTFKITTPSIDEKGNLVVFGGYEDLGRAARTSLSRSIGRDGNFIQANDTKMFPAERRTQSSISDVDLKGLAEYAYREDILSGVYYLE
eukprot:761819-Hanusia_phi.AAC.3